MPVFKYTAIDRNGNKTSGEENAESQKDLRSKLKKSGMILTGASMKGGGNISFGSKKKGPSKTASSNRGKTAATQKAKKPKRQLISRIKTKEKAIFTRQLATMIGAGVSLLKSITVLTEQNENPAFKTKLEMIKNDLTSGVSLSEAMAKHPKLFDKLYTSMVRAGEASGALETVLERLAISLEKTEAIRGKVKSAMMYPVIVMTIAFGITFMLLTFVVPTFTKMFTEAGMELPGMTQFIVDISDFLKVFWWFVLLVVAAIIFILKKYTSTEKGRRAKDKFLLKTPVFGIFLRKVAVGRFTRTMATLLESGVPILTAFDIVAETVNNTVYEEAILTAKGSIKEGNTIAEPLAASGEFPTMVTQMIEIGEESGAITEMLDKVADFNEREVEEAVQALVAAMEPLAIVFMAIVVGTVVVAMFLPMFKIADMAG
jgi:type IV pilus assembly protein PilC